MTAAMDEFVISPATIASRSGKERRPTPVLDKPFRGSVGSLHGWSL